MIVKELYCYERETGKITVSPEKPDYDYSLRFRLIADEDKVLTKDGENFTTCVDVDSTDDWYEVAERQRIREEINRLEQELKREEQTLM